MDTRLVDCIHRNSVATVLWPICIIIQSSVREYTDTPSPPTPIHVIKFIVELLILNNDNKDYPNIRFCYDKHILLFYTAIHDYSL